MLNRRASHRFPILVAVLIGLALDAAAPPITLATSLESANLSGDASGGVGLNRNPGSLADVSPDGRFALFTSTATDLVVGITDSNGGADVFLRDLQAGTTTILSVDAAGNALGTVSSSLFGGFVFGPDSKHLIFRTQAANIVAGVADTNNSPDWFVRDLSSGVTSCLTINAAGTSTGNLTSFTQEPPVFSPDGKLVAFISLAGDLVDGVSDPSGRDLFIRNLETETTELVSVTTAGAASGLTTDDPAEFSPDGRYLAFLDLSPNLVAGVSDTNIFTDLFVRDLETDTTTLVTRNADDTAAEFSSTYEWTPDGRGIVFESPSTALVAGVTDANLGNDLFLWSVDTHVIKGISVDPAGTSTGDEVSVTVDVSPDSRYVAFSSTSTNLTAESAAGDVKRDLYVRDTVTDTTAYVSRNDSSSVAWGYALFSPDEEHLLYQSYAPDEIVGIADTNNRPDIFLYDLATGEKSVVTAKFDGTATANTPGTSADDPVLSPDGPTSRSSAMRPTSSRTSRPNRPAISSFATW